MNAGGPPRCEKCGDRHTSGPIALARCEAAQRAAEAVTKVDAAPKREGKVDRRG